MGKRSDFSRRERDFYHTPESAVLPLLRFLQYGDTFYEPFVGGGHLVRHLEKHGMSCQGGSDIEPTDPNWKWQTKDAQDLDSALGADLFISNPPFPSPGSKGEPTIGFIQHLSGIAPTWLLLPSDFCHNRYWARVEALCVKIVSVGRISWMENGVSGKDNCAWYLFDANNTSQTKFHGRAA